MIRQPNKGGAQIRHTFKRVCFISALVRQKTGKTIRILSVSGVSRNQRNEMVPRIVFNHVENFGNQMH